jgi:uncharacterized lipoprotein YmbA
MTRRWLYPAGRLGGWLVCCALSGCGSSPPTRFYILNDIAPTGPVPSVSSSIAVRVEPVAIAPEVDRPELVTRSGANRVHVAGSERWAAPLPEQIRRVLSDDLAARLPQGLVANMDEPSTSEPRRSLTIAIDEFYGDDSCAVSLRAGWSLANPHAPPVLHGSEQVQIPAGTPCSGELPAAMSRALAALADKLATVIAAD